MRVYFAAPFFTPTQKEVCKRVRETLLNGRHDVFDPDLASRNIWQGRKPYEAEAVDRRAVLQQNTRGIIWSDVVVAWLRGTGGPFTDQGVVWEIGYAVAKGVPVVGFVEEGGPLASGVNLMIAESLLDCVPEAGLPGVLTNLASRGPNNIGKRWGYLTHEGAPQ